MTVAHTSHQNVDEVKEKHWNRLLWMKPFRSECFRVRVKVKTSRLSLVFLSRCCDHIKSPHKVYRFKCLHENFLQRHKSTCFFTVWRDSKRVFYSWYSLWDFFCWWSLAGHRGGYWKSCWWTIIKLKSFWKDSLTSA